MRVTYFVMMKCYAVLVYEILRSQKLKLISKCMIKREKNCSHYNLFGVILIIGMLILNILQDKS